MARDLDVFGKGALGIEAKEPYRFHLVAKKLKAKRRVVGRRKYIEYLAPNAHLAALLDHADTRVSIIEERLDKLFPGIFKTDLQFYGRFF
jgi:hypothetical protein